MAGMISLRSEEASRPSHRVLRLLSPHANTAGAYLPECVGCSGQRVGALRGTGRCLHHSDAWLCATDDHFLYAQLRKDRCTVAWIRQVIRCSKVQRPPGWAAFVLEVRVTRYSSSLSFSDCFHLRRSPRVVLPALALEEAAAASLPLVGPCPCWSWTPCSSRPRRGLLPRRWP